MLWFYCTGSGRLCVLRGILQSLLPPHHSRICGRRTKKNRVYPSFSGTKCPQLGRLEKTCRGDARFDTWLLEAGLLGQFCLVRTLEWRQVIFIA